MPTKHPLPSKLLKGLQVDLVVLSFAFLFLAALLYLEVYHTYALILVPVSEILLQLVSKSSKKPINKIGDKKLISKQKKEISVAPRIQGVQKFLRWARWVSKFASVVTFIILWIAGESDYLYVSIIPCVVASLVSLMVQIFRFSKVSESSLC